MKKLLHVGCGRKTKEKTTAEFASGDWAETRYDIDANASPDIIGSMLDMSAIKDGEFDAVFSSHNIEHVFPTEVAVALSEFRRVLGPDGYLVVTCPDLQSVCELVVQDKLVEPAYQSPAGPISPIDIIYGHRQSILNGNTFMAHKCGFTEKTLVGDLLASGFRSTVSMRRKAPYFDLWAIGSRSDLSEENSKALAKLHFPR